MQICRMKICNRRPAISFADIAALRSGPYIDISTPVQMVTLFHLTRFLHLGKDERGLCSGSPLTTRGACRREMNLNQREKNLSFWSTYSVDVSYALLIRYEITDKIMRLRRANLLVRYLCYSQCAALFVQFGFRSCKKCTILDIFEVKRNKPWRI